MYFGKNVGPPARTSFGLHQYFTPTFKVFINNPSYIHGLNSALSAFYTVFCCILSLCKFCLAFFNLAALLLMSLFLLIFFLLFSSLLVFSSLLFLSAALVFSLDSHCLSSIFQLCQTLSLFLFSALFPSLNLTGDPFSHHTLPITLPFILVHSPHLCLM